MQFSLSRQANAAKFIDQIFFRDDDDTPSTFESELASMLDGDDDDFLDIDTQKGEVNNLQIINIYLHLYLIFIHK